MRESIHKQGQILEIIHNPHMDYDERIARIREIVGSSEPAPKIIQIENGGEDWLYGLWSDGTVRHGWWEKGKFSWRRELPPDIPQDEPAEPDPIAEIEAMGGRLILGTDDEINYQMYWFVKPGWTEVATTDEYTTSASPADLRAAAARLLARVRGASDAS